MDTDGMVRRLKELGVTTYYWLVWHDPRDWDDLQVFLPKAAAAGINVWVYLVPPTEGPPNGYPASEPFKLDYARWGEEIGRLSVTQTNLTGWVIDDFYANHKLFTPEYVRNMQARARAVNPRLRFLPLMYFPELTARFVRDYQEVIDGVVVAYPRDAEEITHARAVLNGDTSTLPGSLEFPWNTPSQAGDFVSASLTGRRVSGQPVRLRFAELDDFSGATAGYHFKQVLVNGQVVWEEDVAGGGRDWRNVAVNASAAAGASTNITVTFRLLDKKGVSNFGVRWRVKELRADGVELPAGLEQPQAWRLEQRGPFEAGFGNSARKPAQLVHIPFIVMTAAAPAEFKLRHGEPASPERIGEWLGMCLDAWRDGRVDGVVTYCLDKTEGSKVFPVAQKLFSGARAR